jgi:Flp pilus assembly protein TadG
MLEFALILPLFLLLLFGILEYALINASMCAFNYAKQDAARYSALIDPTDPNSDTGMLNGVILPRVRQVVAAASFDSQTSPGDAHRERARATSARRR